MAQGLDPAGLDGHAEGAVLAPDGAHLARLSGLADHHGQFVGDDGVQEGDDHHGEHEGHEGVDLREREEGGSETGGDAPWGPPAPWPSERQRRVSLSPRQGCALVLACPPAQVQGLEVGVAGSAHLQASSAGWLEGPWPLCHLKEPPAQGPAWSIPGVVRV